MWKIYVCVCVCVCVCVIVHVSVCCVCVCDYKSNALKPSLPTISTWGVWTMAINSGDTTGVG